MILMESQKKKWSLGTLQRPLFAAAFDSHFQRVMSRIPDKDMYEYFGLNFVFPIPWGTYEYPFNLLYNKKTKMSYTLGLESGLWDL